MSVGNAFMPVEAVTEGLEHKVNVVGRTITLGANGLPSSIISGGVELLASPVRFVCVEDGEPSVWDEDYANNESESFVMDRGEDFVTICGAMQSERFIVNTATRIEEDGCMSVDMKLMPRGKTVAQVFGIASSKPLQYVLNSFWLEIPLRKSVVEFYDMYPNSDMVLGDGTVRPKGGLTNAGRLPEQDVAMPFKALLWLGKDECGLGFAAESDRNWQPVDGNHAIEVVRDGDQVVLRVRLLDSQPKAWKANPEAGSYAYKPVSFRYFLMGTPLKTFPKKPMLMNGLHLDCFIKIKGNYIDFLSQEGRFDRLKEKGVTTLILHEKWNKCQNWYELSEFTRWQLKRIVEECHKRGIKVLTYFGYELSSLAPVWNDHGSRVVAKTTRGDTQGGWWRVPFQRDYCVCYNTDWQDRMVEGISKIMDEFHTDGIYLDGTAIPHCCSNLEHGCGWKDEEGNVHGSYPLVSTRRLMKRLHEAVSARGGIVNVHAFGCMNFMDLAYIDLSWYGENIQFDFTKGKFADTPLDYFRAEYTGRNMGVPVEFIAYENRPTWTFEMAVSMSIIHGILPRPNDIEYPLELMSGIWKIMDQFPLEQSEWCPYWDNGAEVSDERVKVSYYRYKDVLGRTKLLAFCANTSVSNASNVTLRFAEDVSRICLLPSGEEVSGGMDVASFEYKIFYVE